MMPAPARHAVSVLALALASSCSSACASIPQGTAGADADALARKVEAWVGKDAWDKTGGVRFDFRGARSFLWDKKRDFVDVKKGDVEVLLDLWDHGGFVQRAGADVTGPERDKLLADAWGWFCNDTFWLNPLVKLFDAGTARELVTLDGARGLKVTYGAGGVTPGDTYVWLVDDDGRPRAVRMWVSVLPAKGLEFSWEGWVTLATGAKVASKHVAAGLDVPLHDPAGALTVAELADGHEVFQRLVDRRARTP